MRSKSQCHHVPHLPRHVISWTDWIQAPSSHPRCSVPAMLRDEGQPHSLLTLECGLSVRITRDARHCWMIDEQYCPLCTGSIENLCVPAHLRLDAEHTAQSRAPGGPGSRALHARLPWRRRNMDATRVSACRSCCCVVVVVTEAENPSRREPTSYRACAAHTDPAHCSAFTSSAGSASPAGASCLCSLHT